MPIELSTEALVAAVEAFDRHLGIKREQRYEGGSPDTVIAAVKAAVAALERDGLIVSEDEDAGTTAGSRQAESRRGGPPEAVQGAAGRLTEAEIALIELTRELWNRFVALPERHPSDLVEMAADVHRIQDRIAARAAWRWWE